MRLFIDNFEYMSSCLERLILFYLNEILNQLQILFLLVATFFLLFKSIDA